MWPDASRRRVSSCLLAPCAEENTVRVGGCVSHWFKSSYSQSEAACVEAVCSHEGAAMRDSMNRDLGMLNVPAGEWGAFVGNVRRSG
ncbi:DUF397 domain-containing protein [Nocardiopsis sp. CA-288880]|uniref:DUF397 domain-containing protein n=1 Tax=Nocardiopsis sp. CA-288880 TaxID=3239995 RepID=UPI003D998FF2